MVFRMVLIFRFEFFFRIYEIFNLYNENVLFKFLVLLGIDEKYIVFCFL